MRHIRETFYLQKQCMMCILMLGVMLGSSLPSTGQTRADGGNSVTQADNVVLMVDAANMSSADIAEFDLFLPDRWRPSSAKDSGARGAAGTHHFELERGKEYILNLVPIEAIKPDDGMVSLKWNIWSDDLISIDGMRANEDSPVSGKSGELDLQMYSIQTHDVLLGFLNPHMSSAKQIDPMDPHKDVRIGVIVGDTIQFKALLSPDSISLEETDYVWSGIQSGNGETIAVTFDSSGTYSEHLQVLTAPMRTGITTVMEVPFMTEEEWGARHPHRAFWPPTAFELREEAEAWMIANIAILGADLHNGRADAARHAYWNAIMTTDWNAVDAEGLATAHERNGLNAGGPHNESVMDLENNAVGRVIGSAPGITRAAIHTAVIDALHAGDLTILDEVLNPERRGLLQPSNQ